MMDLFAAWTLPAILTALLSGVAFGFVVSRTDRVIPVRVATFRVMAAFAFWYLPQLARVATTPDAADPVRQFSVWLLTFWFVGAMALALYLLRRLNGRPWE